MVKAMTRWYLDTDIGQFDDQYRLAMIEHAQALGGLALLRDYDPELHLHLQRYPQLQVVNLFDWLCNTHTLTQEDGHLPDMRINSPMDKRQNVLEIASNNTENGSHAIYRGREVARLKTGLFGQLLTIAYKDSQGRERTIETYDSRGFLSRTQYMTLDGHVGHELYYRPDGSVGIEISHMQVNGQWVTTYYTNGHYFANLDILTNWWLRVITQANDRIFVERLILSNAVHDLPTTNYLIPHVKADEKWLNNIRPFMGDFKNILVNRQADYDLISKVYNNALFISEVIKPIKRVTNASDNQQQNGNKAPVVTAFGLLVNPDYVNKVAHAFNQLGRRNHQVRMQLVGYFTVDLRKKFFKLINPAYRDRVIERGFVVGASRDQWLQNSDVVWWLNSGENTSNFGPDVIAQNKVIGLGQTCDAPLYQTVNGSIDNLVKTTEQLLKQSIDQERLNQLAQDSIKRQDKVKKQWLNL